jgi:hypothetical protein
MSGKARIIKQHVNDASRAEQPQKVSAVQGCPNKNWIELIYKYDSRRAVSGASYEVYDAATNRSLASGCLDNMGFARVDGLPDNVKDVRFLFTSDPKPFEIFPGYKPKPHNLTPASTEVREEDGTIVSVAKWLGTSLAGDFADDQTYGQIAFGTVVTLIPVVDQVGDVRDIVANLHRLTFRKQYDEFSPWFGLVVTVIGCVPEIGSVVKGVVKALFKAVTSGAKRLPLTKLIRLLNSLGEGNVIRFLRDILSKIHDFGQNAAKRIGKILKAIKKKLENWRAIAFGKAEAMIDELLESISEVYKRLPAMARQVIEWIATNLKNTLDDVTDFMMKGVTRAKNGARQLKEKFIKGVGKGLEDVARRAGMKPEQIRKLAEHCSKKERMVVVRVTNPDSLKFQGETFTYMGKQVNYLPKPLPVKLKTAKGADYPENIKGLVVKPKEPMEGWERQNIAELEKDGYFFDDDTGVLHDKNGNAFHGDYDVQSVQSKVKMKNEETGEWEDVYVNEFSNPQDGVSVIDDLNADVVGELPPDKRIFQHGAEGDFRVQLDEKGNVVKDDHNHPQTIGVDDMNTGGRNGGQMKAGEDYKLGRQYGKDEKYLVVDTDGSYKIAEDPRELRQIYNEAGLPWEYDPTPAKGPAAANAVMGAERTTRSQTDGK